MTSVAKGDRGPEYGAIVTLRLEATSLIERDRETTVLGGCHGLDRSLKMIAAQLGKPNSVATVATAPARNRIRLRHAYDVAFSSLLLESNGRQTESRGAQLLVYY